MLSRPPGTNGSRSRFLQNTPSTETGCSDKGPFPVCMVFVDEAGRVPVTQEGAVIG